MLTTCLYPTLYLRAFFGQQEVSEWMGSICLIWESFGVWVSDWLWCSFLSDIHLLLWNILKYRYHTAWCHILLLFYYLDNAPYTQMFQIKAVNLNEVFILCANSFKEFFNLDLSLNSTVNKWICYKVDNWDYILGRVKDFSLCQHGRLALRSPQSGNQGPSLEEGNAAALWKLTILLYLMPRSKICLTILPCLLPSCHVL